MDIAILIAKLSDSSSEESIDISDHLGRVGSEEVMQAMIELLESSNSESRYLAARTMSLVENNAAGLPPLLDTIQSKENKDTAGDLMSWLEDFDVSDQYVAIFKLYLFGNHKVSALAKELLDFESFNITARVLKKANKHWQHYSNNVNKDELFDLKKIEVGEMFKSLEAFIA